MFPCVTALIGSQIVAGLRCSLPSYLFTATCMNAKRSCFFVALKSSQHVAVHCCGTFLSSHILEELRYDALASDVI